MPDFRCEKCGRTFSMAAHLARHMSAGHASPQKKAAAKRKWKKARKFSPKKGRKTKGASK